MKTTSIFGTLKTVAASLILLAACTTSATAQSKTTNAPVRDEQYGHTLNLGIGIGYYDYGGSAPFLLANYEFDVARNFTLAPFIGLGSYRSDNIYSGYYYKETIIPIGVKGVYYFDDLLGASPDWDFYLGASLGVSFYSYTWQDGYHGDRNAYHAQSQLYLLGHIGAEYHVSRKVGIFLDLSTGVSSLGIGIHGMHSRR